MAFMTQDNEKPDDRGRARSAFGKLKGATFPAMKKPKVADTVATKLEQSKELSRNVKEVASSAVERSNLSTQIPSRAVKSASEWLSTIPQGLLATTLSNDLNSMLGKLAAGKATIYDQAMDFVYNDTHIGGGNHRMFDGGHTILGAFESSRNASSNDSLVQEAIGTMQGLFTDAVTPKGLPLANWDPDSYNAVAGFLDSKFHIPKDWFYDINSYTAAEVLGATIGVVTVALAWNRADTESFSKIVGSMGVSAVISANPLLLIVTVVALARAFHKARHTGEYDEFVDGQIKGAVVAGSSLLVFALMGASAPMFVVLISGIAVGILASKATENVSFVEIGKFVSVVTVDIAAEAKQKAAQHHLSQSVSAKATAASKSAMDLTKGARDVVVEAKDGVAEVTLRGTKKRVS